MRALDDAEPGNCRRRINFCTKHRQRPLNDHFLDLAIDHELKRKLPGGGARDVIHGAVMAQVVEAFRYTVLAQIPRTCTGDLFKVGHTLANQCRIAKGSGTQDTVHTFGNQVDKAIGLADGQLYLRIPGHKLRQRRDNEVFGQSAMQIYAQLAFGGHAAKCQLGLLQFRQ